VSATPYTPSQRSGKCSVLLLAVFFLALTMLILESGSTSAMLFVGLVGAASLMLFSTMKQRNG